MGLHYSQLSAEERGVIMAMKAQGSSSRAIAKALGRTSSTITRELARNGHQDPAPVSAPRMGRPRSPYDAVCASRRAQRLRRKPRRPRKLLRDGDLWRQVRRLLDQGWSPQQISRTLRRFFPDVPAWNVSHETIYTAIYAAPRGTLRRELVQMLRQHKSTRRPRSGGEDRRGRLPDLQSIHLRPPEADARLLPGHWEGDLIKGARNQSAVGVLVDRSTLYVVLAKMQGSSALDALEGFAKALMPLPEAARQTLTYDQGKEMALHRVLSQRTGVEIYFADPHSPWQRGICENTNGLLRQYLPKSADLSVYSQEQLDEIAVRLNHRPRATLDFHCPAEMFMRSLGHVELADRIDAALLS